MAGGLEIITPPGSPAYFSTAFAPETEQLYARLLAYTQEQRDNGVMSPRDVADLGTFIAQARKTAGLSQEGLAEKAGVSGSTILRLERGEFGRPDPDKLQRIARALDIDAEDLFALARYVAPGALPAFGPYLRAKFGSELPPKARKELEAYFERIKDEYGEGDDGKSTS